MPIDGDEIDGALALQETGMHVTTMWIAARSLAVSAALLVHVAPQPQAPLPRALAAEHGHLPVELLRHMPAGVSVDQVLAAMHR